MDAPRQCHGEMSLTSRGRSVNVNANVNVAKRNRGDKEPPSTSVVARGTDSSHFSRYISRTRRRRATRILPMDLERWVSYHPTTFQNFGHRPRLDQCPLTRPTERGITEAGDAAVNVENGSTNQKRVCAARRTNHDVVFRHEKNRRMKGVTVGKLSHRHVTSGSTYASKQKIKERRRK